MGSPSNRNLSARLTYDRGWGINNCHFYWGLTMNSERPKRRDAQENRERLLDAAELIFASSGLDTPVHRVAEEAGVGIGTFYRHFPNSQALISAVFERLSTRMAPKYEAVTTIEDPREALVAYLDAVIDFFESFPHTPEVFLRVRDMDDKPRPVVELAALLSSLHERGVEQGVYRADLTTTDLALMPLMFSAFLGYDKKQRDIFLPRIRTLMLDAVLIERTGDVLAPFSGVSE